MTPAQTLLIVDDDVGFVLAAAEIARGHGFTVTVSGSLEQAQARLRAAVFDVALIDLYLPDGSGLELLEHLDLGGSTQVILITGHPTVESTLKAMHLPIVDYVVKPMQASRFGELLLTAAAKRRPALPDPAEPWHGLAGESQAMVALRRQISLVAPTEASVFIEGESGVGKELVARAIHAESGRAGAFIALDCGAVPADLLNSHLFGHDRGSFNGAHARHIGLFEQAEGGTLFLDELAEMPLPLQVHLLRALETRCIRRVGGSQDIPVDVRLIAATNRPHHDAVRSTRLRQDLYYRLAEFPIVVAPLRDRPEDIPAIAGLFLRRLNERYGTQRRLSRASAQRLQEFSWPGNIRELKNVIQRAYILADGNELAPVLPDALVRPVAETERTITFAVGTPIHEVERRMLLKTLAFFGNNKARAAQALGVTTKTIYNRLSAYKALHDPEEQDDESTTGESSGAASGR